LRSVYGASARRRKKGEGECINARVCDVSFHQDETLRASLKRP